MGIGESERAQRAPDGRAARAAAFAGAALGLVALALLRNGVGKYPFADYLATEVAPHWPHLSDGVPALFQYVFWSPIGPALARLLGIGSVGPYLAMQSVVFVAGIAGFLAAAGRRLGPDAALRLLVVLAALPATTVVLAWSGSYDVFTVVFALALTVCRSPRWAALLGLGLAFSALEHGAIVIALLAVLAAAGIWGTVRPLLAAAGGLVVGGVVLVVWLRAQGIHHGRSYWLQHFGLRYFLDLALDSWGLLLLSLFGAALPLVVLLVRDTPAARRAVVVAVLAAPIVPTLVTEDQTRVFAVLSAPVVVALTLAHLSERPAAASSRWWIALVALAAVTPGYFVWKGSPHLAAWGPWPWLVR